MVLDADTGEKEGMNLRPNFRAMFKNFSRLAITNLFKPKARQIVERRHFRHSDPSEKWKRISKLPNLSPEFQHQIQRNIEALGG